MINSENWTFTKYQLGSFESKVSIGGSYDEHTLQPMIEYCVSTLQVDSTNLYFQKIFKDLDSALYFINKKCLFWNLVNLLESKKTGSCDCKSTNFAKT